MRNLAYRPVRSAEAAISSARVRSGSDVLIGSLSDEAAAILVPYVLKSGLLVTGDSPAGHVSALTRGKSAFPLPLSVES